MAARTPTIRRATPADVEALWTLEAATFASDRISRRQWRRDVASRSASILVAPARHGLAGAAVVLYRRGSARARLYSLAVAAAARRGGVGRALLAAAEADARARGCTSLHLEVRANNAAAIALYERRGYTRHRPLPGFYEDGADGWRYRRVLREGDAAAGSTTGSVAPERARHGASSAPRGRMIQGEPR